MLKTQHSNQHAPSEHVVVYSGVWPPIVAAVATGIASVYYTVTMFGRGVDEFGVTVLLWLGFVALTCTLTLIACQSFINRKLIVVDRDEITFFHQTWRRRSVTLSRDWIVSIDVDTSASDGNGADVIINVSEELPDCVRESRVWNKTDGNSLQYAYGGRLAPIAVENRLNEWLSVRRQLPTK